MVLCEGWFMATLDITPTTTPQTTLLGLSAHTVMGLYSLQDAGPMQTKYRDNKERNNG